MRYRTMLLYLGAGLSLHAQDLPAGTPPWQDAVQKASDAQARGRFAEAEPLVQNAWRQIQRAGAADDRYPSGAQSVVNFYASAGQGVNAERFLHAAETAVSALAAQHPNRLSILTLQAQTYAGQGRDIVAQALYEQLLPMQVKGFGQGSFEVRNTLQTLASSYENSGELEKAEALFERLDSMISAPAPSDMQVMYINGRTMSAISPGSFITSGAAYFGATALGGFYDRHGRSADAEKAYHASITRAELADSKTQALEAALGGYQNYLRNHHRFAEAEQVQLRIMQLHRSEAQPTDANRRLSDQQNLANLYLDANQFDKANRIFEQTRAEVLASTGADSNEYRGFQQNYAQALLREGKIAEAEKVAEDLERHAPPEANDYMRESALNLLAQIREQSGDHAGAAAYQSQAEAIRKSRPNDWDPQGIAMDVETAQALLNRGEAAPALERIEHALASVQSEEPYKTFGFLSQIGNLASALTEKHPDEGEDLVRRVAAIQDRMLPPENMLYSPWLVVNYYQGRGRLHEAERTWNAYLLALENANGPDSLRLADPLIQLANLFSQQSRYQDALAAVQRALSIQEKTKGPCSQEVLNTLNLLVQYYFSLPDPQRAMESLERQIRISSRISGRTMNHGQILISAAQTCAQHEQLDRAIELASEAVDIAGQPDSDPQAAEYFRGVLKSVRQQKAAAAQSKAAPSGRRAFSPWFDTDRFAPTGVVKTAP